MDGVVNTSLHRDDLLLTLRHLARDCGRVAHDLTGSKRDPVLALKRTAGSALILGAPAESLLLALSRFATEANRVAHNLPESVRGQVFALKSAALSALILCNAAIVNDISVDGIVGLDILIEPGARLHCPLARLSPSARAMARRQATFVPVSAPIFNSVKPAQLERLLRLVGRAA